jgi:hypothetical protein
MSENHPPFNLFEGKREDYIKNLQDLALLYITDEGTNRVETIA